MIETGSTATVLESGDALGAVGALRAFKNLMFIVAFICLLILGGAFWMNHLGLIDKTCCPCQGQNAAAEDVVVRAESAGSAVVSLAAQVAEATSDTDEPEVEAVPEEVPAECAEKRIDVDAIIAGIKNPGCKHVICAIRACNFVGFLALVLYSLGLLMIVKISIAGRLGGINHITRGFLLSLLVLVFAIPWQVCFGDVVAGAMFTPKELICAKIVTCDGPLNECVFYFGRFVGLWAIVVVLLVIAHIRTIGWSNGVHRQMGILKTK